MPANVGFRGKSDPKDVNPMWQDTANVPPEEEDHPQVVADGVTVGAGSRWVVRRCRVEVESLQPDGLASGRVIETLFEALPHGEEAPVPAMPDRITFIGGLPGEILELEVCWSLPRPGAAAGATTTSADRSHCESNSGFTSSRRTPL